MKQLTIFISLFVFLCACVSFAETPVVGRRAAQKYFEEDAEAIRGPGFGSGPRYLTLHYGTFKNSKTYGWKGDDKREDVGVDTYGVSYRMYEWANSLDLIFRMDFIRYKLDDESPLKLSLMPLLVFPDVRSKFPLYFGAGIGPGIYFEQMENESDIALDIQLFTGARFMDIYEGAGFSIETGIKNHFHVLTDGQFMGTFLSLGAVFTF